MLEDNKFYLGLKTSVNLVGYFDIHCLIFEFPYLPTSHIRQTLWLSSHMAFLKTQALVVLITQ